VPRRLRDSRLLIALPLLGWLALPTAQTQRFVVAIVRLDGTIVPFASYDAGRWQRAWPPAAESVAATPANDSTPSVWRSRGESVPSVWQVWRTSSRSPIQVRVTGVEVVEAHCLKQLALKTSLAPVAGEHPLKSGIAVDSGSVSVTTIEEVGRAGAARAMAERIVVARFSSREAAEAARTGARLPAESPAPAVRLTALYREAGSPRSPMYFVAEKKYRTARFPLDPQCAARTLVTGWLTPTATASYAIAGEKVFLTDCDGKETRTALPLGAIHVAGQVFWVVQEHGYEDEAYLIAEIGQSQIRHPIGVGGGGC
jgi:hypothetical protein